MLGGIGPDIITLTLSEDAYLGDAQFYVVVDGVQIGGLQTAQALHGSGQGQDFTIQTTLGGGQHSVGVQFVNDLYAGAGMDRNLYVDAVKINGVDQNKSAAVLGNGTQLFTVGTVPVVTDLGGSGPDIITLTMSEDAYLDDAQFYVTIDGVQVGGVQSTRALHGKGQGQDFTMRATLGTGQHRVGVQFINDAYGGTADTDRNLYVNAVKVDGVDQGASAALLGNGTQLFTVGAATTAKAVGGSGPDVITLTLSEDAYLGDAQFYVTIDGVQVGGVQSTQALHGQGPGQDFTVLTTLGTGQHSIGVQFINDAYGGVGMDRNLYVNAVKVNGVDQNSSADLLANGTQLFLVGAIPAVTDLGGSGAGVVTVTVSEDAYLLDAQFYVTIDGVQVGGLQTARASHATGQSQDFTFKTSAGAGSHSVGVQFVNDAYGGTGMDRNLYVTSVKMNGVETLSPGAGTLLANGTIIATGSFASTAATSIPVVTAPIVTVPVVTVPVVTAPVVPVVPVPVITVPVTAATTATTYGADGTSGLVAVGAPVYAAGSHVITVGVGKNYARIDDAIAASKDGDVLLVDAGTYTDQTTKVNAHITIIGVGGMVTMNTTQDVPNQKGILVCENGLTLVNMVLQGAHISDDLGHNAAGVRVDAGALVVENCIISGNQNGILTNAGSDISVVIDHSWIHDNGGNDGNGAGNIHNIYVGDVASFTLTNSIVEEAQVGHEVKSRAEVNLISNNVIRSGTGDGTGSYAIDLPNGGKDTVINNTIVKGPGAENHTIIHFGGEGIPYAKSALTISGNLITNTENGALGLLNQTSLTVAITGNMITGLSYAALVQGPAKLSSNVDGTGTPFVDSVLTGVLPGSTIVYSESDIAAHHVTLDGGALQAVQGGAGVTTVDVIAGHIVVIGGSGGIVINESATSGTGGNQYTTAAGSANTLHLTGGGVVDSEGNDTMTLAGGNTSGQLNGVSNVVQSGGGTISWGVNGTAAIQLGAGSTFIGLGATGLLTLTGTEDFFKVDGSGGTVRIDTVNTGIHVQATLAGGAWSVQTYGGMIHMTTSGGSSGVVMTMQSGDLQFISKGADELHAGSGYTTVQVAGNAKIYAGTGQLDFYGYGSSGADFYGNGGTYYLGGDTGNITYHGGTLDSTLNNGLGRGTILGGAGHITINYSARDSIVGGAGGITLNQNGGGSDTITTAAGSSSVLNLTGGNTLVSNGTDVVNMSSGNSVLSFNGRSTVTIEGGNSTIVIGGTTTMTVKDGHDWFSLLAGSSSLLDLHGYHTLHAESSALGLQFTNSLGAVSGLQWTGGTLDLSTDTNGGLNLETGGAALSRVATSGAIHLIADSAADVVLGGGAASVETRGGSSTIHAGAGTLTAVADGSAVALAVTGSTGQVSVNANWVDMTFIGGSGAAVLTGSSMSIVAGSGSISALGGGVKSFIGGSGVANVGLAAGAKVTLGAGASHFVEQMGGQVADMFTTGAKATGSTVIDNFRIGQDKLLLTDGVKVANQVVMAGSAHLTLSNGGNITLSGVTDLRNLVG